MNKQQHQQRAIHVHHYRMKRKILWYTTHRQYRNGWITKKLVKGQRSNCKCRQITENSSEDTKSNTTIHPTIIRKFRMSSLLYGWFPWRILKKTNLWKKTTEIFIYFNFFCELVFNNLLPFQLNNLSVDICLQYVVNQVYIYTSNLVDANFSYT